MTLTTIAAAGGELPDNCEREPIRIPGAIQPHGALLAFEPSTGAVLHASDNLDAFVPLGGLPVHDRFLADLLGDAAADAVLDGIRRSTQGGITAPLSLRLRPGRAGDGPEYDAAVHVYRGIGFVELEQVGEDGSDWVPVFTDAMQRMRDSDSLESLLSQVAGRIKRMTGIDQVMVYRFDESWNGQVIAERCEPDMESFLGLHYPASDIPAQARELYLTNLVRYIADVNYEPVPVRPQIDRETRQPLDMSHAQLRSVSPMHLRYLRNMGVGATLVMSIVVQGRLWGLVSCHHRQPLRLSQRLRGACRLIALSLGYMLSALLQLQAHRQRESLAELQVGILKAFNQPHAPLADIVEGISTDLLRLGGAATGILWHGSETIVFGQPLGGLEVGWLVEQVRQSLQTGQGKPLFWQRPPGEHAARWTAAGVFGLAAIGLDPFADSGLLWLRPEWIRDVHWGGNPDKAMNLELGADGKPVLTPRNSFAQFLLVARGESRPWDEDTRHAIAGLAGLHDSLVVRESLAKVALSDRRFRSLVALQSDCYWQTDAEGRIMVLSRNLGFGLASVTGQPVTALYAGRAAPQDLEALERQLAERRSFRELAIGAPDSSQAGFFAHLISGEPIRDRSGVVVGMHGTISDITSRRLEEIRRLEAEEAKSQFLATMSHEIRTPLNGVIGYLDLLADMALDPTALRYVQAARGATSVLTHVINDVLDLSRIKAGKLAITPRPASLHAVLDEVVALSAGEADRKQLRLQTRFANELPRYLRLDDLRLRQILLNLLNNAVKFTERGEVVLSVRTRPGQAGRARLSFEVRDSGIGMSAEQVQRLFQPFTQADGSITRRFGGSGLGLTITQRLLQLMGSPGLAVESAPGQGSAFSFELDLELARAQDMEQDASPLAATPLPGLQVLLVEDNLTNIEVATALLEKLGAEVSVALNGAQAIDLLERIGPEFDVILMDMQMPVMDGLTATREILARPDWAAMPIVGLTANAYDSDRQRCLQAGMKGFVAKPVDAGKLVRAITAARQAPADLA